MASATSGSEQRLVQSRFAVLVDRGLALFKSLVAGFGDDPVKQSLARSHAARFKVWAGTVGADRLSGSRSLEYRLRDASFIRNQVLSLLQDLSVSLEQGVSLITGGDTRSAPREDPDPTLEELAKYFQDGEEEIEDELDSVMRSIKHEIDCLLRLSIAIRNAARHHQFKSIAGVEIVEHFKLWDMQHIKAKFPDVKSNILERLGRAACRRRQYLKYREQHSARRSNGLDEDGALTVVNPIECTTTLAPSLPHYLRDLGGVSEPPIDDNISEVSGTSYATSVSASDQLRVPPIPREHENGPIKCPLCHMFVLIQNRGDWKRHVLRDLQPYICLMDDCSVPDHLYSRRTQWMEHIKAEHWKVWDCAFGCPGSFYSKEEFRVHLHSTHGQELSSTQLASLELLCGHAGASKSKEKCPLCANFWCESGQKYEEHVGRHLEDLALFALPGTGDDEGSEEVDQSDIVENSRGAVSDLDTPKAAATKTGFATVKAPAGRRHSDETWAAIAGYV